MKLKEFKAKLIESNDLKFILPNGSFIPAHFHVTEVGKLTRDFIDCGGTLRKETKINFQIWEDQDYDHRLTTEKLLMIIEKSEELIGLPNEDVVFEYQTDTVSKFELSLENDAFVLTNTETDCLAKDKCGVPVLEKVKVALSSISGESCAPGSGCC